MAMRHLEKELRGTGDPRKQAFAEVITGIRESLGSDIPLPIASTPEKQLGIKRFSTEQREALEKQGFVIYDLTGQSIKTLRDKGRKFWSDWHKSLPDFEALTSIRSEVAINPNKLFLPKSNYKTLAQQEMMVSKFSEELRKKVKGVKAIIGQAPDYAELIFAHLDRTKEYLFDAKDNYNFARTNTPTNGVDVAIVDECQAADGGLSFEDWHRDYGHERIYAAPLVVPE